MIRKYNINSVVFSIVPCAYIFSNFSYSPHVVGGMAHVVYRFPLAKWIEKIKKKKIINKNTVYVLVVHTSLFIKKDENF